MLLSESLYESKDSPNLRSTNARDLVAYRCRSPWPKATPEAPYIFHKDF